MNEKCNVTIKKWKMPTGKVYSLSCFWGQDNQTSSGQKGKPSKKSENFHLRWMPPDLLNIIANEVSR